MARERVAILGGGPAALACAWQLSSTASLRDRYEITIWEMGHRLGGKTASSRDEQGRILEHGLHILFGFYESFFRLVREAYAELDRPPEHPLATWRHAFHPDGLGGLMETLGGGGPVMFQYPRDSGVPGDGHEPRPRDHALHMVLGCLQVLGGFAPFQQAQAALFPEGDSWRALDARSPSAPVLPRLRRQVHRLARLLERGVSERAVVAGIDALRPSLHAALERHQDSGLSLGLVFVDLWLSVGRGVLIDKVLGAGGFSAIDHLEWTDWLGTHGAHPRCLASGMGQAVHDAAFSFVDGDPRRPSVAAGSALRGQLAAYTYRGAGFYKMQAGMGEAVLAPLYLGLERRGVRFAFFHRVEALRLDPSGQRIQAVEARRQVELKDGPLSYRPLVDEGGVECWPEEPLWEQVASAPGTGSVESYWSQRPGTPVRLELGRDFDRVVLGIPVGALPWICGDLIEASPRWARMVEQVGSIATIGAQYWLDRDLESLGWPHPPTLLSHLEPPLTTWCDMSHLLAVERLRGLEARQLSYLCGTQSGPFLAPRPPDDPGFPMREHQRLVDDCELFWDRQIQVFLPRASRANLVSSYLRVNCEPHARCSLALPGTLSARIAPGDTGFDNLSICGDWTDNRFHMACAEGSVRSGVMAAAAVCGQDFPIG